MRLLPTCIKMYVNNDILYVNVRSPVVKTKWFIPKLLLHKNSLDFKQQTLNNFA